MEKKDGVFYYYLLLFAFLLLHLDVCVSQDTSGFINIDCGSDTISSYFDLQYSTDAGFIDSGENHNISADSTPGTLQQLLSLRSFPVGLRNCYNLSIVTGSKGNKYLIRARFTYGNYDGKNQQPIFDLHLGVEKWDTIKDSKYREIIHIPTSNYVYVCLVNTGFGIPFISALELRPLNPRAYSATNDPRDSLQYVGRWYFALETDHSKTLRFPDDVYDRRWLAWPTPLDLILLKSDDHVPNAKSDELPPPIILESAVTPNVSVTSIINLLFSVTDTNTSYFFCFHFSEVAILFDQDREFDIYLNDAIESVGSVKFTEYLQIYSLCINGGNNQVDFNFKLKQTNGTANLPVVSAVEMYAVKQFLQSQTDENDVFALVNIKATYGLKKQNWQGDPCLPRDYLWEGLDCITDDKNASFSPRIKSLDLSFSNLSGEVTIYISKLASLQYLDLSNNSLVGKIPRFLSEMPSLKVLILTGNNFSGEIPHKLLNKNNTGQLILRIDQIKEAKKPHKLVPILISLALALILVILILLFTFRKKLRGNTKRQDMSMSTEDNSTNRREREGSEGNQLRKFTYAEIKEMTNDFETPIGKGGFGEVFHGIIINGLQVIEVAVKRLFRENFDAYKDFIVEVNLLKYASHPNLTPFLGYCDDEHVVFVFQYMPNGSLNKFLSHGSPKDFTWRERLNIALGAAQGLLYLHEECQYVHRDIKPENILLDENYEAKLADFGLVREIMNDETHVTTLIRGSPGYLDPEYFTNQQIRRESDIFSFGIVLFQLINGWPAAVLRIGSQNKHVLEWVKNTPEKDDLRDIVDAKLNGNFDKKSAKKALKLAKACACKESAGRPTTRKVVNELIKCLELATAHEQSKKLKQNNSSLDKNPQYQSTFEIVNDLTASVSHGSKSSCFSSN